MATAAAALSLPKQGVSSTALMTASFLVGDVLAVSASLAAAVLGRWAFGGDYAPEEYLRLCPLPFLFGAVFAAMGLYPGIVQSAVSELRRLTLTTTFAYLSIGATLFVTREGPQFSRGVFLVSWLLTVLALPLTRHLVRSILGRQHWWGTPVVIFGAGERGREVLVRLKKHPELGLRPVAVFNDTAEVLNADDPIPVFYDLRWLPLCASLLGVKRAILAAGEGGNTEALHFLELHAQVFTHVYVLPELEGLASFGVVARDIADRLSLEVRRAQIRLGYHVAKRLVDSILGLVIALAAAPLIVLIAVLIRLDSRGPAFYRHTRLGLGGREFELWKFRTMRTDADSVLAELLERDTEARAEWETTRKLRSDPRITRLGLFLRRTSLDELPQLWNVLRGEMSLVGPRPIVQAEIPMYGEQYSLYRRVLPGLTGLWQVSGRSSTTYEARVGFDAYYVRNWSFWLDVYLLARTFGAVLQHKGAY
jgi:Undecaprenyl-phosphate galactose phosphotransferase WbaP